MTVLGRQPQGTPLHLRRKGGDPMGDENDCSTESYFESGDNLWDNRCDNHGIKPGVEITSGIYSDRPNSDGLKKHLQAFKSLRSQRKREPHTWVSSKSKRSKSGSESSSSSSSSCSKLPILRNSESWCYSPKLN